jgi:hypothetical protein
LKDLCVKRGVGSPAATDETLRAGLAQWLAAVETTTIASPLASVAKGARFAAKGTGVAGSGAASSSSSSSSGVLADPVRLRCALLSWNAVQACRCQALAAPHRALFVAAPVPNEPRPSLGRSVAALALAAAPAAAAGVYVGITLGSRSSSDAIGAWSSPPAAPLEAPSVKAGKAVGAVLVAEPTEPAEPAEPGPLETEPPVAPQL